LLNRRSFCLLFFAGTSLFLFSQTLPFLDNLFKTDLKKHRLLLEKPSEYKLQVVCTKIERDKDNKPQFTDYSYQGSRDYVYPASTVKLPGALLALIKLEELNIPGLTKSTAMFTDSDYFCQKKVKVDASAPTGYPKLENYIKKMFLINDNHSFARTYKFVGYNYAQKKLVDVGFKNIRLFNRSDGDCQGDAAMITPRVYFLNENKDTLYKQGVGYFRTKLVYPKKTLVWESTTAQGVAG